MVEPTFEVPFLLSSVENALENDAELKLEETLIGHVHTPIVALGVGYRF